MNVFEFLRDTISDHKLIKNIAQGTVALTDQELTQGYKRYTNFIEANLEDRFSSIEAQGYLDLGFNYKAYTLRDAVRLQLELYEKFKNNPYIYFNITHFISNFFNLTPIGVYNRNLDRLDGFGFQHEDLSLEKLFTTKYHVIGALDPRNPEYRFYGTMPIATEIFKGCQTPFEVLALAARVIDDNHLVYVKNLLNGNAKFEWYLPLSEDERKKLLKRKSKVDIGQGEYFSLKDIISGFGKEIHYNNRVVPYTADVLNSLSELMT